MRALSTEATNQSVASLRKKKRHIHDFDILKFGLELEREELYQRIDARMDKMIEDGLFEEAEKFYSFKHLNALQTVGYREIYDYLDGKYDREEAVRLLKRNSRRYAKRQMTWFKKDAEMKWVRPNEWKEILNMMLIR